MTKLKTSTLVRFFTRTIVFELPNLEFSKDTLLPLDFLELLFLQGADEVNEIVSLKKNL